MNWIAPHFTEADLGPEDVILHKVHSILADDLTLQSVFGAREWIQPLAAMNPYDFERFPKLLVTLFNATETPGVGILNDALSVFITVRYEMLANKPLAHNSASMGTLIRHVMRLLSATGNKLLNETVEGQTVQLVRRSNPGPVSFRADRDPDSGRWAFNQIIEWQYETRVDATEGRIRNVVLAGG